MKNAKRLAAFLLCLGLLTAIAVPAALAERSDAAQAGAEQRTEEADEVSADENAPREGRGGRGSHAGHEEAAEPENAIGRDAAKEAALADAGLTAEQVEKLRARVSDREGTVVYKVSFRYEGQKYSYKIDPLTGTVLDRTVSEAGENHRREG